MPYKPFQLQDYARLALTDGAILAHDTGLGKTWAGYTYPLLKCGFNQEPITNNLQPNAPVLIVAPGDLHDQWIREGADHFHTAVTRLDSQATFLKLSRISALGLRILPAGFYITSYTALGHNGVRSLPNPDKLRTEADAQAALSFLASTWQAAAAWHDEGRWRCHSHSSHQSNQSDQSEHHPFSALPPADQLSAIRKFIAAQLEEVATHVGCWNTEQSKIENPKCKIKCIWDPTLADLCSDTFQCVVVDEGTKIKGGFETQIGTAVLQMNPFYRLVCTATPIKNRLPNLFALAWWACGGKLDAHSRWPYSLDDAGDFARTFCVSERNLTREAKAAQIQNSKGRCRRHFTKLTPQVCNVHKVWKLLAPIILRRRKKDIGEDIVPKFRQVYRVPMGTLQAQVYKSHLEWDPVDVNGKPAIGPKIQALRMAAAAPHSALLPLARGPAYCPKIAATLTLVEQILRRGKQVIIFSPFHDPLDEISRRLNQAGVPHEVLDGRTSPTHRGIIAARFKLGPPPKPELRSPNSDLQVSNSDLHLPIILAGTECMAEGHSFPLCSYVIQYSYPWALDKVLQSEDRAHRLNSVEPLQIYRLVTEGSVDRKMESQIDEKCDAAELVLDGHLIGEQTQEVNLAELLDIAAKEFDVTSQTIDEKTLEAEWYGEAGTSGLRDRLREAAKEWSHRSLLKSEISNLRSYPPTDSTSALNVPSAAPAAKRHWRARWQQRQLTHYPTAAASAFIRHSPLQTHRL